MHLYAIGVYRMMKLDAKAKGERIKIKSAQVSKSTNDLENIESVLDYPFFSSMKPNVPYLQQFTVDGSVEYNYLLRLEKDNLVFVICSRGRLEQESKDEKQEGLESVLVLFKNIEYVILKPQSVSISLEDIIINPLFKRDDAMLHEVRNNMEKSKAVMFLNINKAIVRGELIESLLDKAIDLEQTAIKFTDKTKKMNHCCNY